MTNPIVDNAMGHTDEDGMAVGSTERTNQKKGDDANHGHKKDGRNDDSVDGNVDGNNDNTISSKIIKDVWESYKAGTMDQQDAISKTSVVLAGAVDEYFIQPYKQKCAQLDDASAQIKTLSEELKAKTRENDRLKESNQKKTESMQNLIKAVGNSNEQGRDESQAKLMEAKFRADILKLTVARDENAAALMDQKRKCHDLQEENKIVKTKYQKEQAEKLAIERDYRTLKSTVTRLSHGPAGSAGTGGRGASTATYNNNNNNSNNDNSIRKNSDLDYYKQKYENEKLKCQSQKSLLEDKDREIANLKRDRDRHLSQNVLASIRAKEDSTTNGHRAGSKKGRYSY